MINTKGILVRIIIHQWSGEKLDHKATSKVAEEFEAKRGSGKYQKKLLPGAKSLQRLHSLNSALREFVKVRTLPWYSDGTRVLSGNFYFQFNTELKKKINEIDQALEEFLGEYEKLKIEAQGQLGELFNDGEYPSEAQLRASFGVTVRYSPIPSSEDFRIDVEDSVKAELDAENSKMESEGVNEVKSRIEKYVTNAIKRLSDPNSRIYESLIGNIQEVCELMPYLNISNDQGLNELTQRLQKALEGVKIEEVRNSSKVREDVANELKAIESSMSIFGGQND